MPQAPSGSRAPSEVPVPVEDLSGGLDQRSAPTLLGPTRSRVLRNWSLRTPGALIVFPGWVSFSTASLGAGRPQGGRRIYLSGVTPFTLAAWTGGVYKPSDAGVWGSVVSAGWDAGNSIFFPYDRDMVAIVDGATEPKKSVNGTTWTNFGIAPPAAAPTAALVAGGSLVVSSTYEFSYTGRDDGLLVEGNESDTVQKATSGGNLTIRLTLPFHPDTQVDTLVIYGRDVTAGETVRRRIGTVANPLSGTTVFDVTANIWGSGTEAPTDHTVPPTLAFAVVWKNRWWGRHASVKNRLHFTQIFEPQSWGDDFFIDIPFQEGDDITAILPLGDTLLVFGQSKIFLVIGQTSLDFEVRPSAASQAGALGPASVDTVEDGAIHAAADGIYLFNGATDRLLSFDVDGMTPSAVGWRDYITGTSPNDLAKTPLAYYQATKEVVIGVTTLYPFGTPGEWVLDLNRTRMQNYSPKGYPVPSVPAWTTTDRAVGGYIKWDGNEPINGNHGRVFSWSQSIGKLYEERTGTSADGSDLVATYIGPDFAFGGRIARVTSGSVEFEPHAGTFGIELQMDNRSLGSQTVNIAGSTASYDGASVYETAVYDGPSRVRRPLHFPLSAEGLSANITGTYTGQESFKWFTYKLGIMPESVERGI